MSWPQMWDAYRLQALTAYVAAGVTASFSGRLQGETATRAGLTRAVAAVTDLDSFAELRRRL